MDKTRRMVLQGTSTLPLALLLHGCGGGGGEAAADTAAGAARATAQSALPATAGYVDIRNVLGYTIDNAVFRYSNGGVEYLEYFVPDTSAAVFQAMLNTVTQSLILRINEVITPPGSTTTHHRSILLRLPSFPTAGNVALYDSSSASRTYTGTMVVNTINTASNAVSHYEYTLQTGGVKVTNTSSGGFQTFKLEFIGIGFGSADAPDGSPATTQTYGTVPASNLAIKSGTNLAAKPFLLLTATNKPLVLNYLTESVNWI